MAHFFFTTFLCTLFLSNEFLRLSFGADALLPNQTISIGQTLISHNQDFEMGFFSPGNSQHSFVGIWFKNTPDIVVWVANRNNPIINSHGVTFSISRNGSLVISRPGSIIWSANPLGTLSHPILQLLDSGNLILVNETREKAGSFIWQSFDYPTDTMLPGMKVVDDPDGGVVKYLTSWRNLNDPSSGDFVVRIENHGLPGMLTSRGNTKTFRTGKWNGRYISGVPTFPSESAFKPKLVFRGERLISLTEGPRYGSMLRRSTLDISGVVHIYTMSATKDKWNHVFTVPGDRCDEYGLCGPNGICSFNNPTVSLCKCLRGFAPKFQKEWDLGEWSSGCTRIAPLSCKSGDSFQELRGVKHPDMLDFWLSTSMSLDECKAECLKNCNCTAFANAYITNGGSGCVIWFGDLVDSRDVPGADSKQNVYIRVPASELVDDSNPDTEKEKKRPPRPILISIAAGVIVSGFINGGIFMIRRPKKQALEKINEDLELPLLKFATIVAATNNFSKDNIIGEGGFGPVYKGILPSKEEIAIKRLSTTSGQGLEEFRNEAIFIAKLQHKNLVRLLGCCIEGGEKMLIYEYLQNKSLDYFVFDQNRKKLLTWPNRFNIVMGICRGLLYLHQDSRLKIIHRDLKTSNILLDGNFHPKISDFGLARAFGEDQPGARTRTVVGTYGYMAPEYAIAGKYSAKSDIFSMGVVLLEIVSGKKNRGFECSNDHFHSLLGHAWVLWKENTSVELMDECLEDTFVESEVKRCIQVGLLCVQNFAEDRPAMSSVLFMLGNDEAILPEPKEPGFLIGKGSTHERRITLPSPISERNTITITDLEAR